MIEQSMADTVLLKENGAPGLRWSVLVVPWDNLKVSIRSARSRLLTSDDARGFQALGKQGYKTIHFACFARRFDSPGESPLVRLRLILFPLLLVLLWSVIQLERHPDRPRLHRASSNLP